MSIEANYGIPDEHYFLGGNVWAFRNYLFDRRLWMAPSMEFMYSVVDDFGNLFPSSHRPELADYAH